MAEVTPDALDAERYPQLSDRQRHALPIILGAPTVSAGLDKAEVPRSTWYRWKADMVFQRAYRDLIHQAVLEALNDLKGAARYAVTGLMGLMTSKNEHIRLQACREVLNGAFKAIELGDLAERIERLEQALAPLIEQADV